MFPCYAECLHAQLDPEAVVHPEQPLAGLGAAALHRAAVAVVVAAARPGVGRARGVAVVQALGRYYLLTLCYHVLLRAGLHLHLELVHVGELRVAGAGHARVHRGHHVLGRVDSKPCHQWCYLVRAVAKYYSRGEAVVHDGGVVVAHVAGVRVPAAVAAGVVRAVAEVLLITALRHTAHW